MKAQFIKRLIKSLIEEHNFLLPKDRDGNPRLSAEHSVLAKNHFGNDILLELLDGDRLTAEEINARLHHNREFLAENKSRPGLFFWEIFIFESDPDADKLAAITAGQIHNLTAKTFLKCLSVNLTAKTVEKHFTTVPKDDFNLTETIARLLAMEAVDAVSESELIELSSQKERELMIPLQSDFPLITHTLIGLNILIGALLLFYSQKKGLNYSRFLIDFGAKENYKILSGEYWRFLTPIFLHANLLHLFVNCYSLHAIGVLVERIIGRSKFLAVYLIAGIMGNILSFIFSTNPGVGASGSIFGLLGALLYFGILKPSLFKSRFGNSVVLTIIINLGYGFINPVIDNFAHLGGLIGGFSAAGTVLPSERKWYTNRLLYLALTVSMIGAGLGYGFQNPQNQIIFKIRELEKLDRAQKWEQAEGKAKEILRLNPRDQSLHVYTLWTLAKSQALSGNYPEAIASAKKLTAIDSANGHYLQGVFYFDMGKLDLARAELEGAKKAGADYEMIDALLEEINRRKEISE